MSNFQFEDDLDPISFEVKEKNAQILLDGFNEYAFLMKFPPFSITKNAEETQQFMKAVRDRYYELSNEFHFDDSFRPWKKIEKDFASMLEEARRYRDDSRGNIHTAVEIYRNEHPDETLSMIEAVGGHLEL